MKGPVDSRPVLVNKGYLKLKFLPGQINVRFKFFQVLRKHIGNHYLILSQRQPGGKRSGQKRGRLRFKDYSFELADFFRSR